MDTYQIEVLKSIISGLHKPIALFGHECIEPTILTEEEMIAKRAEGGSVGGWRPA